VRPVEAAPLAPVVSGLAITAVKGTRLRTVGEIALGRYGVRENRRFYVVDDRDRMVNGKQLGELSTVVAVYDDAARRLTLTFPSGDVVDGAIELGDSLVTRFFSADVVGRLVVGPWSEALSRLVGREVRLVEAPSERGGVDRGERGAATLISRASLSRLAREAGEPNVDGRRFRMLIEIDGVPAHAEDEWVGRSVRVGEALVAFVGNVGRCIITSRDPESGTIDLPTLNILGGYRRGVRTTEALPFGVYGQVLEEGIVRVGDSVSPQ
jgi:hypothetical protein